MQTVYRLSRQWYRSDRVIPVELPGLRCQYHETRHASWSRASSTYHCQHQTARIWTKVWSRDVYQSPSRRVNTRRMCPMKEWQVSDHACPRWASCCCSWASGCTTVLDLLGVAFAEHGQEVPRESLVLFLRVKISWLTIGSLPSFWPRDN